MSNDTGRLPFEIWVETDFNRLYLEHCCVEKKLPSWNIHPLYSWISSEFNFDFYETRYIKTSIKTIFRLLRQYANQHKMQAWLLSFKSSTISDELRIQFSRIVTGINHVYSHKTKKTRQFQINSSTFFQTHWKYYHV